MLFVLTCSLCWRRACATRTIFMTDQNRVTLSRHDIFERSLRYVFLVHDEKRGRVVLHEIISGVTRSVTGISKVCRGSAGVKFQTRVAARRYK